MPPNFSIGIIARTMGNPRSMLGSCFIGKLDREERDFPPKPKWMRWKTYRRYERRFDRYDAVLDSGIIELAAKLCWRT